MKRRTFLESIGACVVTLATNPIHAKLKEQLYLKKIPSTGESIPAIGMGTSITFNVGNDPRALSLEAPATESCR